MPITQNDIATPVSDRRPWQDIVREEIGEAAVVSLRKVRPVIGVCPGCSTAAPCASCVTLYYIIQERLNIDLQMRYPTIRTLFGNSEALWPAIKDLAKLQTNDRASPEIDATKKHDHEEHFVWGPIRGYPLSQFEIPRNQGTRPG